MKKKKTISIYHPEDRIDFGKYKNEELKFIYTFEPTYIEWLIINTERFFIFHDEFIDLNTLQIPKKSWNAFYGTVNANGENLLLRDFLTEYTDLMDIYNNPPETPKKFTFNESALSILIEKENLIRKYITDSDIRKCNSLIYYESSNKENYETDEFDDNVSYSYNEDNNKVYDKYGGPSFNGETLDDNFIDDVLDGDPSAYWNID